MSLSFIAALPREVSALVRGVQPDSTLRPEGVYLYRLPGTLVVCAGMGAGRATLAVAAARAAGASDLVSVGLAGACSPQFVPGTVVTVGCVVDALSGERFATQEVDGPVLVTSGALASVQEKARLHATYGAALVDMEAATVARLARAHGLRFRAVKAVSDAHDFELSSLAHFSSRKGHFRTAAFALHTALRPHRWRQAAQLGAASQNALRALTATLEQLRSGDE